VRVERGLDLLAVHDRLGRPITQIEALEHDDIEALPDDGLALSTLRRYATLLGLDGDDLATRFIAQRETYRDASATRATPALTSVAASVTASPDHLRAFTETGEVPQVGNRSAPSSGASRTSRHDISTGPPTGTFPVLPRSDLRKGRRQVARARRRMNAPRWLKVLTWTVGILVLLVAVGSVLLAVQPRTLADAHILRVVPAGSAAASSGGGTRSTVTTTPAHHQTFPVQPAGSTASGASYTVATPHYDVVVATSGPCWVQVTSSSAAVPLVAGVQQAGKVISIPAVGTMTVEVGSSAVLIGISIKGKSAFTDAPKAIPFTYTFSAA
jgi:cytoskeletal protein RodZ